jgi:hypothetical protein
MSSRKAVFSAAFPAIPREMVDTHPYRGGLTLATIL